MLSLYLSPNSFLCGVFVFFRGLTGLPPETFSGACSFFGLRENVNRFLGENTGGCVIVSEISWRSGSWKGRKWIFL